MIEFVSFDTGTGRLLMRGRCIEEDLELQVRPGSDVLQVADDIVATMERFYVCLRAGGPELIERPAFPASIDRTDIAADGRDQAVITGLPKPCTILVDGVPVERKAGTLTLTSEMPADYEISADHWPFLPWRITVRAR